MDLIQKLIEMPDKDIKKPDNKSLFADDNLYREMFSKGEIKAQALYKGLEERSRIAGAFTEFKRRYMEHKKEFIKHAEGLSDTKKIDILDLPALNIPSGYKLDMNQGILKFNETTLMFEQICPQIVIIEARYINIDSGEEKNKITFVDRFKTKSLIVDAETVSNSRSIVKLRNMGIMVTSENAKSIVVFLSEFLACNIFHIEPEDSISRIGWHDGEFIPYNSTCIFDGEQENKHLFEALDAKGELSDWIDYIKELRKNKLFRMQLASSFSSPLIEITNSLPFVFHLWGGTGSGKAQPLDTKIITPEGFKLMGDIRIGDRVIGEDGKAHKVSGVYPQGIKDVYQITFADKTTTRCCKEHLWKVSTRTRRNHERGYTVLSLEEMLKRPIKGEKGYQYKIPVSKPVEFTQEKQLPIDPYLLGAFIGDGCLTLKKRKDNSTVLYFNNSESDIIKKVSDKLNDIGVRMTLNKSTSNQFFLAGANGLKGTIRELGLDVRSPERFIPELYKKSSIESRLEILKGLIDTDGHVSAGGSISFCSHSETLANDVCEIVRSLGGRANFAIDNRGAFKVTVICNFLPFSSNKHKNRFNLAKGDRRKTNDTTSMAIIDVKKVAPQECQCIMVDSEEHTYLCDDYIVTHNTVGLMVAMSIWGNPTMGKLVRTMNMTQNSMMTTAGFLYNIPFAGDELQIIKSRWTNYDNLIMAITEGVDRGRMDGHVNRSLKRWHCNFLFTGEEPCTNNNSGGGTRNRVIEIECTGKIVDKGNETVNFIKQNYGLAGREFLEHIKEYDIQKEYISLMNQLIANSKTTEKQAMSLALILLADKITSEKMFNDEPLSISEVVEYLKDDADVDASVRAFSFITDWFTINQQCFSGETENLAANKQIYGRIDSKNENLVYVVNTALKDALHSNGFSFDSVAGKWKERGWLLPNTQGRNVHNTRINGKKANCYKLNFDTIEEQTCMNEIEMIEEIPF